jgi:hypothetical protein
VRKQRKVGRILFAAVLLVGFTLTSFNQVVRVNAAGSSSVIETDAIWQKNNMAYLNYYWFSGEEALSDQQMKDRVLQLQSYNIKYQLTDIGKLVSSSDSLNGTLPAEGYKQLARWIKISRETDPNQKIIVLVNDGKRVVWQDGQRLGNPYFGNAVYNENLRAVADTFINKGVIYNGVTYKADGIQLDIEPFLPDDPFLKKTSQFVRQVLKDEAIFSIAAPVHPSVWSESYTKEMAGIFNMLCPMMYDQMETGSPITSADTYQQFWKTTTIRYAHAIAGSAHPSTMLMPVMPAYGKNEYHDPTVENILNSAKGLKMAREQLLIDQKDNPNMNPNGVIGAAVFWWGAFMYQGMNPWDGHDYAADRTWWAEEWLRQK